MSRVSFAILIFASFSSFARGPVFKMGGYEIVGEQLVNKEKKIKIDVPGIKEFSGFFVGDENVFWEAHKIDPKTGGAKDSKMWVKNLKTKKSRVFLTGVAIEDAPPNGFMILIQTDGALKGIDPKTLKTTVVAPKGAGRPQREYEDGYTVLGWSDDSSVLWFGAGIVEGYYSLGEFRNGKLKFHRYNGYGEAALHLNTGIFVSSNAQDNVDEEGENEYISKKVPVSLSAVDVQTGKSVVLATGKSTHFNPQWIEKDVLSYNVGDKTIKLTVSELAARLK